MVSPHDISDLEFYILHTTPWIDNLSPVYVKDAPDEVFAEIPVLRQARRLLKILEENGGKLKLTAKGNLPGAVVKELYSLGVRQPFSESFYKSINMESKAPNVCSVRLLMTAAGFVRKQNNMLLMVKKNAALAENPRTFLERLLYTYSTDYNIGCFDYLYIPDIHYESALMYLLLARYGDTWRKVSFYRSELVAMQPMLECVHKKDLEHGIDWRIFSMQMTELGLLERDEKNWIKGELSKVRKSPLFDQIIGVRTPKAPIILHSNPITS